MKSTWHEIGQDSTFSYVLHNELKLETMSEDVYIQKAEGSAQFERKWLHS